MTTVRIASRKSPLAMWQTHFVARLLEEHCGVASEIITMDTTGDLIRDKPLPEIGGKGLFTRELEEHLTAGTVDLAVHSLKDLPSELPDGLCYAGSPTRANPYDALISTKWSSFDEVPADGTIATGSVRRRAQLASKRAGLSFVDLRGNIDTRIRKLDENGWDGIIMAAAALDRLERSDLVADLLTEERGFVPAVGQGAIGIEIREDRSEVQELITAISCVKTVEAVRAERRFMNALEGGCSVSVAAHCRRVDNDWVLSACVSDPSGEKMIADDYRGEDPQGLAATAIADFVARGAIDILGRS